MIDAPFLFQSTFGREWVFEVSLQQRNFDLDFESYAFHLVKSINQQMN